MHILLALALVFIPMASKGDAVIFSGLDVKALKYNLDLFGRSKVMGLNVDPTAGGGVAAPLASIGMDYLTGEVFFKNGPGNTDWINVTDAITGPANTFAGYDANGNLSDISQWTFTADGGSDISVSLSPADQPGSNSVNVHARTFTLSPTTPLVNDSYWHDYDDINLTGANDFDFVYGNQIQINKSGSSGATGVFTSSNFYADTGSGTVAGVDSWYQNFSNSAGSTLSLVNFLRTDGTFQGTVTNYNGVSISPIFDNPVSNINGFAMNAEVRDTVSAYNPVLIQGYGVGDVTNYTGFSFTPNNTGTITNYTGMNLGGNGPLVTNFLGVNVSINAGAAIPSYTAFNSSPQSGVTNYQGLSTSTADNGTTFTGVNVYSAHDWTNFTGLAVSPGGGVLDDFKAINITPGADGTNMIGVNFGGTGTFSNSVTGINLDMSGFTVTPSLSNPTGRKVALSINGGSIQSFNEFTTVSALPALVDYGNNFSTQLTIESGSPITGTDFIGDNMAGVLIAEDDYSPSAFGIGWSAVGLVGQVSVLSGATVDKAGFMVAGGSIPASSTGGTITDLYFYEAKGLANAGGTLNVTNSHGFKYENTFGFSPTNEWGVHVSGATVENYFENAVAIGTSSEMVTNSSVGLEIGGTTKAFRNPVLTTTERDALTPLSGMQVFNDTTNTLNWYDGASWQPVGSGTVTSVDLAVPSIFTVSGNPITTSGTITVSLANQTANTVFAGPSTGAPAAPTFRALVDDDLPVVSISKGGTGQTSQTAGFDALAPTTTKGDLIVHDGTDNIRVAVGVNGRVLTANSATASGVEWAVPSSIENVVTVSSSPYTALASDSTIILDTTSGAITVDLPDASTVSGLKYYFIIVAGTNAVTIDPNSTQTVCGNFTASMYGTRDVFQIVSNGSNWEPVGPNGCERVERTHVVSICNSSPCTIAANSREFASSITRAAPGEYTLNINTGVFAAPPTCVCSATDLGGNGRMCGIRINNSTTTAVPFATVNTTGSFADSIFTITCQGLR